MTTIELLNLSKQAIDNYKNEFYDEAEIQFLEILEIIKSNITILNALDDYRLLGSVFTCMLTEKITDNLEDNQLITNLGYLFTSKALKQYPSNGNIVTQRLIIMEHGIEYFKDTVAKAIDITKGGLLTLDKEALLTYAKMDVLRMEFADLEQNPITYNTNDSHKKRRIYIYEVAKEGLFNREASGNELLESGIKNHNIVFDFLDRNILQEGKVLNSEFMINDNFEDDLKKFINIAKLTREGMMVELDWLPKETLNNFKKYAKLYGQIDRMGDETILLRSALNQQNIINILNAIQTIEFAN